MRLSIINREIKDVFYLIALQGLNYIAPLLVLPYLIKVLGAEKFGYIGFSLSVMQYLMLIVDFGFNLSATKRVALAKDNQDELNNIFTSTLYAKAGLLLISFLVLAVFSLIPRFEVYRETLFIMFLMVVGNTFTFVWLFQGMGKIRMASIVNATAKLSILPLTFIFVKIPDDYLIAALLQSLVAVAGTIISIWIIIKEKWVSISSFIKKNILFELKESFPIFLSSAATSIYMASFVVVLGYFATPENVGQYSAAERLIRAGACLLTIPVIQVFYPKISQISINNPDAAIRLVKRLMLFITACMTVLSFILFFFSSNITTLLGQDYHDALNLFQIMAFIPIFAGISLTTAQLVLLAIGKSKDKKNYQHACIITGIIAFISIFAIIPFFHTEGAAFSLLLTEIIICVLMLYYSRRFLLTKTKIE